MNALWITPAGVYSLLKYSWTEKIAKKRKFFSFFTQFDLKLTPGTSTAPAWRGFSGKGLDILNFRQKHMKVLKICYTICPYWKKSEFCGKGRLAKNTYFFPNQENQGKLFLPCFSRCFQCRIARNNGMYQKMGIEMKEMVHSAKVLRILDQKLLKITSKLPKIP